MAAATIFGNLGGVTISASGVKASINQWQAAVEIDAAVAPASFGEKWEEADLTAARITGSLNGKVQYNAASTKPFLETGTDWSALKGTLTLTAMTGCTWVFTAIFTNVSLSAPRNGYVEFTANFRNSGSDLAVTWDET